MSKELKNLLEDLDSGEVVKIKYGECYAYSPDVVEELKQALTELKAIKEAKPSVAIGELETLKELFDEFVKLPKNKIITRAFDDIKQTLLNAQELEKENVEYKEILDIIKEKGLPLGEIKMIKQSENYEKYVIDFSWANFKNISIQKTKEEFDLLKRYLNGK